MVTGPPRMMGGTRWYPVAFGPDAPSHVPEDQLEVYEAGLGPRDLLLQGAYGPIEGFRKLVTSRRLASPLSDTVYSFRSARIEFYPYQFRPLLKFLKAPRGRLLIADEVGLGKTIEAGLILIELAARGLLDRVLIVCPSALCTKWQVEMEERFNEEFQIADAARIRQELDRLHRKGGQGALRMICSIQTLRRREFHELMENLLPSFDLTIVDEAHHMRNPGTLTHAIGRILSDRSEGLLLLTATPIHIGAENLHALLRVLDSDVFEDRWAFERILDSNRAVVEAVRELGRSFRPDLAAVQKRLRRVEATSERDRFLQNPLYADLLHKLETSSPDRRDQVVEIQASLQELAPLSSVLTRTRKRQVHTTVARRAAMVRSPDFSPEEMEFYERITEICRAHYRRSDGNPAGEFGVITRQRQMASSIPAMIQHCLRQCASAAPDMDEGLEVDEFDDFFDGFDDQVPRRSLLEDPDFRSALEWGRQAIRKDTKLTELVALLKQLGRSDPDAKVIVFTYFKGTLRHICEGLDRAGIPAVFVSGDVRSTPSNPETDDRRRVLERFRDDPAIRVLVSTEVGGEGLDLQFARVIVNFDLPWNPMIVEQRIGRLDRIGQKAERITIVNFSIPGTIETRILDRLYSRIRIFEESIGDLESILGTQIRRLTGELLSQTLTPDEEADRIEQVARVLEEKRLDLQRLEREGSQFLAYDAYLEEEVDGIERLRRYVSPEEVELFVHGFLAEHHPACELRPADGVSGLYRMTVSQGLVQFVRDRLGTSDRRVVEFSRLSGRDAVVTFLPELAFERRNVEQISHRHPLVQAIVLHYEEKRHELHPVAFVGVESEAAPAGDYFYELLLVQTHGVRASRVLEPIFIGLEEGDVLPPDASQVLLGDLLTRGVTVDEDPTYPPEIVEALLQACDDEFGRRAQERRADLERVNAAIIANRLASLDASRGRVLREKRKQLEEAKLKGQDPRYIRMLEGTIRNLSSELETRMGRIESCRSVEVELLETVGAGILRVE